MMSDVDLLLIPLWFKAWFQVCVCGLITSHANKTVSCVTLH